MEFPLCGMQYESSQCQEFFGKNQVSVIPWVTVLRAEIPGQTYLSSDPNFTAY